MIANVCVYCGSGSGRDPAFTAAARTLGAALAAAGLGLVYGGGGNGMMGDVARAVLAGGGHVTGIIPKFLVDREVALAGLSEMVVTDDMHERKRLMFERSDAFVALPGGIGTLEELVEIMTWAQLDRHKKPIVVANIAGFWEPFLDLIAHMRAEKYLHGDLERRFVAVETAEQIVPAILAAARQNADGTVAGQVVPEF